MARQSAQRSGDFTGRMKAELAQEHAAEQEAAAQNMALITAQAAAVEQDTVVLEPRREEVKEEVVGEVVVQDVDVAEQIVEFRVNETLEQVTIGHGNHYDFVEGQRYKAPQHIYNHLEEKGLIWH